MALKTPAPDDPDLKLANSTWFEAFKQTDADASAREDDRVLYVAFTRAEELLIAWLKTRLARRCRRLRGEEKLGVVYSWHDLRHAFAERNAGRGLVWLRDRLGHSSVSVTERYLRNVLNVDTGKM